MSNEAFWRGIIPTLQTPLDANHEVDHALLARQANHWVETGCSAVIALGSRAESDTFPPSMKIQVLQTLVSTLETRVPVVAGIDASTTHGAIALSLDAERAGCAALMVSFQQGSTQDRRHAVGYVSAIIKATSLPCILHVDPAVRHHHYLRHVIALVEQCPNLQAVKAVSCDIHLFAWLRDRLGERIELLFDLVLSPATVPRFVRLSRLVDERRRGHDPSASTRSPASITRAIEGDTESIGDVVVACPTP